MLQHKRSPDTWQCSAEAFGEVAAAARPRVLRFALAALRDPDAAENVTQECLFRACSAWSRFRGDSSPQTWLISIAVNLIRDTRRRAHGEFGGDRRWIPFTGLNDQFTPDPRSSPEKQWLAKERIRAVRKAVVEDLSPRQRTIFLLHFVKEMDVPEITATTGIANATVRVHLSRAARAIRRKLAGI
jgi:RNA polymerase sigma-70 factor (ECF subfamily)